MKHYHSLLQTTHDDERHALQNMWTKYARSAYMYFSFVSTFRPLEYSRSFYNNPLKHLKML